jgi:hypothetical protein
MPENKRLASEVLMASTHKTAIIQLTKLKGALDRGIYVDSRNGECEAGSSYNARDLLPKCVRFRMDNE